MAGTALKYYEATVEYTEEMDNGKEKKRREVILVDALSVTETEVKVTEHLNALNLGLDFIVKQVKESKVIEVI
jgi:hypothetical protein